MHKFCPNCGYKNNPYARYCEGCQHNLSNVTARSQKPRTAKNYNTTSIYKEVTPASSSPKSLRNKPAPSSDLGLFMILFFIGLVLSFCTAIIEDQGSATTCIVLGLLALFIGWLGIRKEQKVKSRNGNNGCDSNKKGFSATIKNHPFSFLIILFIICAIPAGIIFSTLSNKAQEKEDALLQSYIDLLHSGKYDEAKNGFLYMQEEYNNSSSYALHNYANLHELWNSSDLNDKMSVIWKIDSIKDSYSGTLADEVLSFKAEVLSQESSIERQYEAEQLALEKESIASGKPYVGMDSKYINQTILGPYDKTGYNEKREFDSKTGKHKDHQCTLYYWMDGSSCIFIARVQNDIGEVIDVEDHPKGSYFGN